MGIALKILGGLLILFAIIDIVAANIFAIDLTGVMWSPIVAGIGGSLLLRLSSRGDTA